ncbi:hypothetical protein AVEN_53385-1 [Araneus ventricosus]|uniref:Uncharacterized protein n=1 Tax=Araneus ventricosus TaxID=182803 RepID=A0A4Y2AAH1_ARAVE|nr:hypothetical protein AVEN_53385-1 [Araneus ventricosus]
MLYVPGSRHIIALQETFWILNRDSSVKSTWPHCSGVQLRCSRGQCNCALTCAGDKGTQTTGIREKNPSSCSLLDTICRDMGLPAAAGSSDTSCRAVSITIKTSLNYR